MGDNTEEIGPSFTISETTLKERLEIDLDREQKENTDKVTLKERLELDRAQTKSTDKAFGDMRIYKIPRWLREAGGDKAYDPQLVSIGPYHHGKNALRNMEQHKVRALNRILSRTNQKIEDYIEAVEPLEEAARACYEGPICQSSNKFVEMMILDACFALEFFRAADDGFGKLGYHRHDTVFTYWPTKRIIMRDLILLENQIPLFILDKLFSIQNAKSNQKGPVALLAVRFFSPLISAMDPKKIEWDVNELKGPHCLAVFRETILVCEAEPRETITVGEGEPRETILVGEGEPSQVESAEQELQQTILVDEAEPTQVESEKQELIQCATKLRAAGIRFKKQQTHKLLDITFEKGILYVPPLMIRESTKLVFLNLIAYEQYILCPTLDITTYVKLMDALIDTSADVSLLGKCGIIENWLGSEDEVAKIFNQLCYEAIVDMEYSLLWGLPKEVNRFYKNKWNTWGASYRYKYFHSPLTIGSFFAAFLFLALTVLQTFYTVYSYYSIRPLICVTHFVHKV